MVEEGFLFWMLFWSIILAIEGIFFVVVFYLVKAGGLWRLMMFRLRHGSLYINCLSDNGISFEHSKNPKPVKLFKVKDEQGNEKEIPTRITKVKHHLQGTSHPVHICIIGQEENVNLLERYKPSKSAEYWNQWGKSLYQAGLNAGKALREEMRGFFDWHNATTWLIIIAVCGILLLLAMNWMILNNMAPPTPAPTPA